MESALTRPIYLGSEVITSRVSTSVGDSLRSLDAVLLLYFIPFIPFSFLPFQESNHAASCVLDLIIGVK